MAFVHTVRLGDTSNNGAMFVIQKRLLVVQLHDAW
jgi:hypothetical protein